MIIGDKMILTGDQRRSLNQMILSQDVQSVRLGLHLLEGFLVPRRKIYGIVSVLTDFINRNVVRLPYDERDELLQQALKLKSKLQLYKYKRRGK